jgi:hypothetical protein
MSPTVRLQPAPGVHASDGQAWAILLGFLAFAVVGVIVYMAKIWSTV